MPFPVKSSRNKMSVIAKALATLGNPSLERTQVSTTLSSLPDSWEQVVISLNMSLTGVTMKNLLMLLTLEYERRNKRKQSEALMIGNTLTKKMIEEPKQSHANFSKNKHKWTQKKGMKRKRFSGNCYNCGKPSHQKKDCRVKNNNQNNSNNGPNNQKRDLICVVSESLLAD